MKKDLLLFTTAFSNPNRNVIAATLAWICQKENYLFEIYYDSYQTGVHFGGGDYEKAAAGALFGGTVLGAGHMERFYLMLDLFSVQCIVWGKTVLSTMMDRVGKRYFKASTDLSKFYGEFCSQFGVSFPNEALMVGTQVQNLNDLDVFCYPDIYYEKRLGVLDTIADAELLRLQSLGLKRVFCLYVPKTRQERIESLGLEVKTVEMCPMPKTYLQLSSDMVKRWGSKSDGFIICDPVSLSYWIPWACRHRYLGIYSKPQVEVMHLFKDEIKSKSQTVFGRQYDDQDFKVLSQMDKSFQIIDPQRPAFPVISEAVVMMPHPTDYRDLYCENEPTDEDLLRFAHERKILSALLFWSGAVREVENIYRILELVEINKFKIGLILTVESYHHGLPVPLDLMRVPIEQGGVYPYVEPILGSTGLGIAFEAYMSPAELSSQVRTAYKRIVSYCGIENVPRGWWPALDGGLIQSANRSRRTEGRPYADYMVSPPRKELWDILKAAGLQYAFSTYGLGSPLVLHRDDGFIVLNQTAGVWEGWSPFVDIDSLDDVITGEKRIVCSGQPGWLVGTFDSCLWTFSYHHWRQGHKLKDIVQYILGGGTSGRIINTTPHVISRYARILLDNGFIDSRLTNNQHPGLGRLEGNATWLMRRSKRLIKSGLKRLTR